MLPERSSADAAGADTAQVGGVGVSAPAASAGHGTAGSPPPVRLWIDRSFTIRGAGTVVTGTLPAGTVRNGQELLLTPSAQPVRVRGLQALGEPADQVAGVARVALNLRGVPADLPARGMALIEPGRWTLATELDVRITPPAADPQPKFPPELLLHIGAARTQARLRVLGRPASRRRRRAAARAAGRPAPIYARLRLRDPLPLHAGDRVLLRDPGAAGLAIYGATVLDPAPPPLARRGAGAAAVRELSAWPDVPTAADLLRRHKLLRAAQLAAAGADGAAGRRRRGLAGGPGALGRAAGRAPRRRGRLLRQRPARPRHADRGGPRAPEAAEPGSDHRADHRRYRPGRRLPPHFHQARRGCRVGSRA